MADNVKEEIIFRHKNALNMILYGFSMVSAVILGIIAAIQLNVMLYNLSIPSVIAFVVIGGSAVLMWFGKDNLRVEYEYSFTNGVVDIAKVINNRRRRELISFKTREVELVASVDDPKLNGIKSRPNLKKISAVLNGDSAVYFASFRKNEVQYLVYFEPSADFLKMMRIYNERNVII
jgi:hypothetical protein